jgi:hypothetical protein
MINDLVEEFKGSKAPFFKFSEEKNIFVYFLREKKWYDEPPKGCGKKVRITTNKISKK